MKTEVLNTRKCKDSFEAALYALPFALRVTLRREQVLLADRGGILPKLYGQFGSHRHIPNFPSLELRAHGYEAFGIPKIAPDETEDFSHSHTGRERNQNDQAQPVIGMV